MLRQTASANAHPCQRIAPSTAIEEAGNACEDDNRENQNRNGANHHPRAAADVLQKRKEALAPALPSLPRHVTEGSTSLYSSFSSSVSSLEKRADAAAVANTAAVAVAPSPFSVVSHIPTRMNSGMDRAALLTRDPRLLMPPLRHNETNSTAVSPQLNGGGMDATMSSDQLHLLPIPSMTPPTDSAIGGSASAPVSTTAVDRVNGKAHASRSSRTQVHCPPTAAAALPFYSNGASDGVSLADPPVAAAVALHLLPPSFGAITAADTSHLTPATQSAGEGECLPSCFSGHRTTSSAPDFQPSSLTHVTHTALSSLGLPSEKSLAAGATATSVTSEHGPAEEGSGWNGKYGDEPAPRCRMTAVLETKTTPLSALASDIHREHPRALSAPAAATAQQRGVRRSNTHRNVLDSRCPFHGGTRGPPSVSINEALADALLLRCAASDAVADTVMSIPPLAASARQDSTDTAFRQLAARRHQVSPPPAQPPLQEPEALLPPPTTRAPMQLSASFPAGEVLSLDGTLRSCADDAALVSNMSKELPLSTTVAFAATAGTTASAPLFDSPAGVAGEFSAMRRRAYGGVRPAPPVQQARFAKQNPPCSALSMRPDVFQHGADARAAAAPATPADGRTVSTSPQRAARTAASSQGGGVLPRDDGTAALQLVLTTSQEFLVPSDQRMGGGVPDAPPAATMEAEPERYPQALCDNPPGQAADTASQLPHPASESVTAVLQLPVNAAASPANLVANSQALSANTSKDPVARSSAAAQQAPSPSPAPQPPTAQRELAALHVLPMPRIAETARATQRHTTVSLSRSVERYPAVSGGAGEARGGAIMSPCPSAASVMSINVNTIAASPHARASAFERRDAPSTPRSTSHQRSSTSVRNEPRGVARIMLSVSAAPLYSFAHVTHGEQAQTEPCRLFMCSSPPPRPPPRRAAHTAPLPVCITAASAAASSSTSSETTPLCRPADVRDAVAEDGALPIIPATIDTAGSNASSLAASELLGVLKDWTPTQLAVSQPLPASQRAAAVVVVAPGADVEKPSTRETPLPTAANPATQAEALDTRAKVLTRTTRASDIAETAANLRHRDARGFSAAASPVHHNCRGLRVALQRDDRRGTVFAAETPPTSLPTHVVPVADNLLKHPTTAPPERRARGGELSSSMAPITRLPASESATATPFAWNGMTAAGARSRLQTTTATLYAAAAANVTNALPLSSGPSWERMEPLPVGHLASATPTVTPLMARTLPLHSVPAKTAGTRLAIPHCVPTPPSLPLSFQQQCTPRGAVFTSLKAASRQHPSQPAAPGRFRQPPAPTMPRQREERVRNGSASGEALATPPHTLIAQQLAGGAATSTSHQGEVVWEVLPGTHSSSCDWPNPAPSCPSSVASSRLQRHQLQAGWRSGLPRSLPFVDLTRDSMPIEMLGPKPEAAMRHRPFSTELGGGDETTSGGPSRRQARPVPHQESQAAQRSSPSPWPWWRGQHALTPGQRLSGRVQRHGDGARTGDFFVALPPNPDMVDGADNAAAPHCRPTLSSSATAVAAGGVGSADDGGGLAPTAYSIPAAPTSPRLCTAHLATTRERAGGRAGAAAAKSATSGCATAGQPLHRVAAAAPAASPGTTTAAEAATLARTCTGSGLTGVTDYYGAYQRTQQPRSTKSGPPPPSQTFRFQPSMVIGSQSPQDSGGREARGSTGTASRPGSQPVAEAGMALPDTAAAAAAGSQEPRRHYFQSGTPLQRYSDGTNAALRDCGGVKGDCGPQRAPRLTRSLLDQLQRSYAAVADASSRPRYLPIDFPLKEALVASWHDAIHHGAHSGNDPNTTPAMLQRPRPSSPSRGQCVENLHATVAATPMVTRSESPIAAQPDLPAAAQQERLYMQRCTSSSPSPVPVAPPLVVRESYGAVLRTPHPQALPFLMSSQQAQPPLQEMTFAPAKILATPPSLASLEHQQTPVLTAVATVSAGPPPMPWSPKGNGPGANSGTLGLLAEPTFPEKSDAAITSKLTSTPVATEALRPLSSSFEARNGDDSPSLELNPNVNSSHESGSGNTQRHDVAATSVVVSETGIAAAAAQDVTAVCTGEAMATPVEAVLPAAALPSAVATDPAVSALRAPSALEPSLIVRFPGAAPAAVAKAREQTCLEHLSPIRFTSPEPSTSARKGSSCRGRGGAAGAPGRVSGRRGSPQHLPVLRRRTPGAAIRHRRRHFSGGGGVSCKNFFFQSEGAATFGIGTVGLFASTAKPVFGPRAAKRGLSLSVHQRRTHGERGQRSVSQPAVLPSCRAAPPPTSGAAGAASAVPCYYTPACYMSRAMNGITAWEKRQEEYQQWRRENLKRSTYYRLSRPLDALGGTETETEENGILPCLYNAYAPLHGEAVDLPDSYLRTTYPDPSTFTGYAEPATGDDKGRIYPAPHASKAASGYLANPKLIVKDHHRAMQQHRVARQQARLNQEAQRLEAAERQRRDIAAQLTDCQLQEAAYLASWMEGRPRVCRARETERHARQEAEQRAVDEWNRAAQTREREVYALYTSQEAAAAASHRQELRARVVAPRPCSRKGISGGHRPEQEVQSLPAAPDAEHNGAAARVPSPLSTGVPDSSGVVDCLPQAAAPPLSMVPSQAPEEKLARAARPLTPTVRPETPALPPSQVVGPTSTNFFNEVKQWTREFPSPNTVPVNGSDAAYRRAWKAELEEAQLRFNRETTQRQREDIARRVQEARERALEGSWQQAEQKRHEKRELAARRADHTQADVEAATAVRLEVWLESHRAQQQRMVQAAERYNETQFLRQQSKQREMVLRSLEEEELQQLRMMVSSASAANRG
ncbi:hypothetical protein CGC20_36755 [Leishmania donovani]|uniref:Uncharacterized protein n=1 Tax=Leishmania donovani TaxID=5661 RepID=A0A504X4J4_LEIDO|nr:hypothetical protein CGC20_36755 [Leishmania donovani]